MKLGPTRSNTVELGQTPDQSVKKKSVHSLVNARAQKKKKERKKERKKENKGKRKTTHSYCWRLSLRVSSAMTLCSSVSRSSYWVDWRSSRSSLSCTSRRRSSCQKKINKERKKEKGTSSTRAVHFQRPSMAAVFDAYAIYWLLQQPIKKLGKTP